MGQEGGGDGGRVWFILILQKLGIKFKVQFMVPFLLA